MTCMVVFGLIKLLATSYSTLRSRGTYPYNRHFKSSESFSENGRTELLFIQGAHIQDQQVNNIYKQNFSISSFFILRLLYRQIYR